MCGGGGEGETRGARDGVIRWCSFCRWYFHQLFNLRAFRVGLSRTNDFTLGLLSLLGSRRCRRAHSDRQVNGAGFGEERDTTPYPSNLENRRGLIHNGQTVRPRLASPRLAHPDRYLAARCARHRRGRTSSRGLIKKFISSVTPSPTPRSN